MIQQLLKGEKIRITPAREAVLDVILKAGRPLSHQEIESNPKVKNLNRVTIYRALAILKEKGIINKIQSADGIWHFCGHTQKTKKKSKKCSGNHIHFLCCKCNQMSCLPEQPLPWINAPMGAKILSKQLLVTGHCAKCEKKNN